MIGMAVGSLALLTASGKAAMNMVTRVPQNTAGIWEHHGRPVAIRDGFMRRHFGWDIGQQEGELYEDVEAGSHGHRPWLRSIAQIGTHLRYSDLASAPIDNTQSQRQHNLDGTVIWQVAPKRDSAGDIIRYERDGIEVPYKQLVFDAIYKARSSLPEDKDISAEQALEKIVVRTCGSGLKEVMQKQKDSHRMESTDVYPLLQEKVTHGLFEYGVIMKGLLLGDTHLTDLIPQAMGGLVGGANEVPEQGVAFTVGDRRLRIVRDDPPTPA
jgi:hypothetical protein